MCWDGLYAGGEYALAGREVKVVIVCDYSNRAAELYAVQ